MLVAQKGVGGSIRGAVGGKRVLMLETGAGRLKTDAVASKWVPVAQNGPGESKWYWWLKTGCW